MEPLYFPSPADFRAWLQKHHAKEQELLVGFHKKSSGEPSITWPESVDAALCFGWIDGVRKNVDSTRYTIRFTPRRPGSIWSKINIDRVQALIELGLMQPAGLKAFEKRTAEKSAIYSYEQRQHATLGEVVRTDVPEEQESLGLLSDAGAVLPTSCHVLGDQRQTGRNPAPSTGHAHRRLRQPA